VGALVPRVLRELGLEDSARAARIADRWEEAVGAEVAGHCRPTGIRGGVLEAEVDSSTWCQTLRMRSPELLAGLRDVFGEEAPESLRFRIGGGRG
jgi:predicted nucleic acid-binding Zn ribbon protein